jgi:hypothetical protein
MKRGMLALLTAIPTALSAIAYGSSGALGVIHYLRKR